MSKPRVIPSVTAALITALALAGCSAPSELPEPLPSASVSATTEQRTQTTSATQSAAPSATPSPTFAPATGQLFTAGFGNPKQTATFRVPAGMKWLSVGNKSIVVTLKTSEFVPGTEGFASIGATIFPQIDINLDRIAQLSLKSSQETLDIPLKMTGYRAIKGVKGFVFQGANTQYQAYVWGGLYSETYLTTLTIKIPKGVKLADWVEPVLASVEWK
ncbi:hypothetical protein UM93_09085 [Psychromicrobium lacuslunae]|uniref:Lipoprotein n=2 Tax=Psychromicrobium lacuslunae TaxID=1618207 RepID=A0A0D4BZ98_9MICC|nr:hypothetical protein UM93_09085 [Psychromicrobium lacuslunae]